jgi:hypothetical protein
MCSSCIAISAAFHFVASRFFFSIFVESYLFFLPSLFLSSSHQVVLGKEPLDVLHERVLAYFTDVKDLNVERPLFESNPYDQLGFRVNVVSASDRC